MNHNIWHVWNVLCLTQIQLPKMICMLYMVVNFQELLYVQNKAYLPYGPLHLSHIFSFKNSVTSETLKMEVCSTSLRPNLLGLDQLLRCIQSETRFAFSRSNLPYGPLHLSHISSFKNSDTSEPQTLEMKVNQPPQGQNLLALDQVLRCIQSEK